MQISPAFKSAGAAVLGLLLLAPAAFAADGESTPLNLNTEAKQETTKAASGGGLVRTIVGLAIVIGVIYGLYWVLKQVKSAREDKTLGTGLQTLATLPLGPNRAMHLVRAGDEVVLVGVGEGGVTPIRTYGENEARALGLLVEPDEMPDTIALPAPKVSWLEALRRKTVIK
jgi:flagellar protein FliO/FliZ